MEFKTEKTAVVVIINNKKIYPIGIAEITIETDDILPDKIVTLKKLNICKKEGVIFQK